MLKDEEDAFGHSLYEYQMGENPYQVIERDDGHIDVMPVYHYFTEYEDWPEHQKDALKYVEGKVLDIGCGAGKHAIHLQNEDFDVIGIDISPLAIEVCKRRGLKDARIIDIAEVDEHFDNIDTVLMLGNNFGLFGGKDRAKTLLKKLEKITSDHATIIAESRDPHDTDEDYHLRYHEKNQKKNRLPGHLVLRTRYKIYATPWFDYLLVSQREMKDLLKNSAWEINKFFQDEERYIALIEKK